MGFGWTHNYQVTLAPFHLSGAYAYQIIDETNRVFYFQDDDVDGVYTGILGTKGALTLNTDGTYTWRRGNGITYAFNQDRQFVAKTDGNGNVQSLEYDIAGRLGAVTDEATGRSIGFQYDANSRIAAIGGPVTEAIPDGVWVRYEYDTAGNLARVEYADGSGFEYRYEDPKDPYNLTEKSNLAGEFLSSWQYDAADRAWNNTTRDGKGVAIYYGTDSIVVIDTHGSQKTYTIETVNGRKTITNISGGTCSSCGGDAVRYGYDDQRRVNEIEYANGRIDRYEDFGDDNRYYTEVQNAGAEDERTFHYTYHPETGDRLSIRETSVLGAGDRQTLFDYDDDGNAVPNENPTRLLHRKIERGFTHDETGALIPYEYITRYAYDARGNVLEIDGPLDGDQDKISYTYDPVTGDRLTETRPLVGTIHYGYDAAGNLTEVTDVNGQVTTISYDGRNRQLAQTGQGITQSRAYTAAGELDSTTDALGRVMDYSYNTRGFLEKITDPGGDYLYYGYNEHGRRTEEAIYTAGNARTFYRGTDYGTAAVNPAISAGKPYKSLHYNQDGTAILETTYAYDASGNLDGVIDANGNETVYRYDQFDRLEQVIQPQAGTDAVITVYDYDRHGNLASVTDAQGHVTRYTYDDLGRLVMTVSPDTGTTRHSYDAAGNLRYKVHNGKSVEYRYDILGRLTRILYSDPAQNVTMTYDSGPGANLMGRLASVTDASGLTEYSYDSQGSLVTETKNINGVSYVTGYGYDHAGNLRAITYPTGQTIAYVPDLVDPARIAAVRLDPDGANQTLADNIAYQPFGPTSNMVLGNTVSVSKTFDLNYQLAELYQANGTPIMDRAYTPDNVGNITAIADNLDTARSQSFAYDALYRLTGAAGIYGSLVYTYDRVGNRTTRALNGGLDTYYYHQGTNRLQTIAGIHSELFEYDADGNTTKRTPGASNPNAPIGGPSDYLYNAGGQRVTKTNSAAKVFHYDQAGQLIAETDPAGNPIKAYVWLHGQPLAQIAPDGAVYYYHNDHLGTPQRLTDAAGAVVWAADYLPFGQADVTVSTVENNLRFSGQYYDAETGLHYNYYRYYDPSLGRYLRADPIGLKGGVNLFNYSDANPIKNIDPLGLWVKLCSRELGPGGAPVDKDYLRRHDFLSVSGLYIGFQHADHSIFSVLMSQGRVEMGYYLEEDQGRCHTMICDDSKFDQYVIKAANYLPFYNVIAFPGSRGYQMGARNCQTWAQDVIDMAISDYLNNENCPRCFH